MGISLKQAFSFVPQDKKWINKIFIGGLLMFFPTFAYIFPGIKRLLFDPINYYMVSLAAILVGVTSLAVCGYFFKTVHNRIVHFHGKLPSWKYFSYYIYIGLKAYIGAFVLAIPFFLVSGLLLLFAPFSLSIESIPFILTGCILHIIYAVFYIMLALNFAMDFRLKSFFDLRKAYELIKHNLNGYVLLVFDCLLVAVCNFILSLILINGQIFALLLPFVTFYIYIVYSDLFAQFALSVGEDKFDEGKCFI